MNELKAFKEIFQDREFLSNVIPKEYELGSDYFIGGQGVVWKGNYSNIPAAIKLYFPNQDTNRIHREIEAMQNIDNPSIVKILAHTLIQIENQDIQLIATEYIEGEILENLIQNSPLDFDKLSTLLRNITRAIDCIWEKRIVHRDIKPANIIQKKSGDFCLIDLGVARHIDRTSLTTYGSTWGTTGYLSPEQMKAHRKLTCKSDIFSLGIVICEACIGRHPTNGDQRALGHVDFHNNLPQKLKTWKKFPIIKRMLSYYPYERPNPKDILMNTR